MVLMRGENFPIDVYNGTHYTMTNDDKVRTASRVHSHGHANPVLVARLSSKEVKTLYFQMNGVCVDQGKIVTLDTSDREVAGLARELGVLNSILIVPPITVKGSRMDGDTFNELVRTQVDGTYSLDFMDFAPATGQIPTNVLRKVTGALRLLYVSTEYRMARNGVAQAAAILLQRVFNVLLTHPKGIESEVLTDRQSKTVLRVVSRWSKTQADEAFSTFERMFWALEDIGFLRRRGSKVVSDGADHPHSYLEFIPSKPGANHSSATSAEIASFVPLPGVRQAARRESPSSLLKHRCSRGSMVCTCWSSPWTTDSSG